jgi:LmbE family N-acetylglucosaminyl deacetylase
VSEPVDGGQDRVTFRHDESGTDEATWRGWRRLARLPPLDWDGLDHVVVVAAHPDDETLGAGGLMAEASRRGIAVDVVVATLGEASHPLSSTITPERLSRWRAREVAGAVGLLAPRAVLHLLHLPDGRLEQHVPAVTARVAGLAGAGSLVVAPWVGDGHPDHTAAGLGAARAAADVRARSLEYPVWAWHWSAPGDPRVPWQQMVRHPLTPAARRLKRRALALHRSQTRPLSDQPGDETLLGAGFLDHFHRPHEVFVGPRRDPAGPESPA